MLPPPPPNIPIVSSVVLRTPWNMMDEPHLTQSELEAGLDTIRQSPKDAGPLALIVRRPQIGEREVLETGELDLTEGLRGDTWRLRGSSRTADGSSHPDMQLN